MKSLYQFFTLLKKHILLRRRQPSLLLLEILWPILVFTIVAIIRSGIPPFKLGKCDYPTRAMPSAGLVPFMQNFVCNLNNQCETKDISKQVTVAEDKIEATVSKLAPLVAANNSLSSLKILEKMVDAIKMFKGEDIEDVLKNSVLIKDLFKDPDKVQEIFVDQLNIFDKNTAEGLLNSKINLKEILSLTGYIGLKEIACNKTLLNSYIIFPQNTNISLVSAAICAIDSSMIPNITETVQQQINMINILKKVSLLMKPYSWAEGLSDLTTMIDTFLKIPTAQSFFKDFKDFGNLAEILKKIPKWLSHLQIFDEPDLKSSEELLKMMDPFLLSVASNKTLKLWEIIKDGLNIFEKNFDSTTPDMQYSLDSIQISLKHLFDNSKDLAEFLWTELNLPRDVVQEIMDKEIIVPSLLDFLKLFNETDKKVFFCEKPGLDNILSNPTVLINSSSSGLHLRTVQHILCTNFTKAHMEFLNKYLNISSHKVKQKLVYHAVSEFQDDINNVVAKFKDLPPEVENFITAAAYAEIGQIATLLMMPINESSFEDNLDTISEYFVEQIRKKFDNGNDILQSIKKISHVADTVLKYLKSLPSQFENKEVFFEVFENLNNLYPDLSKKILKVVSDKTSIDKLKEIYTSDFRGIRKKREAKKVEEVMERELAMNLKSILKSIEEIQNYELDTWLHILSKIQDTNFLKMLSESGILSKLADNIVTLGPEMEADPLWKYFGPFMKQTQRSLKAVNDIMSELADLDIQFEELLMFQLKYGADIVQSMLVLLENPQVNQMLRNTSNPEEILCSKNGLLNSLAKSSGIPINRLRSIVCESNFTRLLLKVSSLVEVVSMFEDMQSGTPVSLDWKDFASDLKEFFEAIFDIMKQSNKISDQLMTSFPHFDLKKLMAKLSKEMDKLIGEDFNANMLIDAATKAAIFTEKSPLIPSRVKEQLTLNLIIFDIYLDVAMKGDLSSILNIFTKAISQSPTASKDMLAILNYSFAHPQEVLKKLLQINRRTVCQNLKISQILVFPPYFNQSTVTFYENVLCKLNWTVIANYISKDPPTKKISMVISSLYGRNTSGLNLNLTELSIKAKEFIKFSSKQGGLNNTFDLIRIYHLIFWEQIQTLSHMNISNVGKNDSVAQLALLLFNLVNNKTLILPGENNRNLQILSAIINYIDLHVRNIQGKTKFYLMDYIDSPELFKMLTTIEFSEKLSNALFVWLETFIKNPQKMVQFWFDNMEYICDKRFLLSLPKELASHTILCEKVFSQTNITRLIEELENKLLGFYNLIQKLKAILDNSTTDTTKIDLAQDISRLSRSIMVLMQKPPMFYFSSSTLKSRNKNFKNMLTRLTEMISNGMDNEKLDLESILKNLVPVMEKQMGPLIAQNPQSYYMMMNNIDRYLKKLDAALPNVEKGERKIEFEEIFGKDTEMLRMYKNMEDLPSVVSSLMFNILTNTDQKPFMDILESSSVAEMSKKVCTLANYQRFATPSCILFDLNKFVRVMCHIDYNTLEKEMENAIGFEVQLEALKEPDTDFLSISPKPPNMSSILTTAERLWKKMEAMSMVPNSKKMWKPLNLWMNQKPQMDAMIKQFVDMSPKLFDLSSVQYLSYFEKMVSKMFFDMEHVKQLIVFEEKLMKFVNLNLEKIIRGNSTFGMVNSQYSELRKLIYLINTSEKSTEILMEGIASALENQYRLAVMLDFENWKNMCSKKNILTMMFPLANPQELSVVMCDRIFKKINMTALEIEVNNTIPGLKDFLTFLPRSFVPGAKFNVNYTAVAVENLKFQKLIPKFMIHFSTILSKVEEWPANMLSAMAYQSLNENWETIENILTTISSSALRHVLKSNFSKSGMAPNIIKNFNHNLFTQYNIVKFLNYHLSIINASSSFDLLDYINSTELRMVFKNAEKIPKFEEMFFNFFLHMIKNQDNIEKLFGQSYMTKICLNKNMFYEFFNLASLSIDDVEEIRKVLCDTIMNGIDMKKLQMELMENVIGLKELIDTITNTDRNNSNLMPVEFQKFIHEVKHLQKLLIFLSNKKLDVQIGGSNQWFNGEKYKNTFLKFENISLMARSEMLENFLTAILSSTISDSDLLKIKSILYQQLATMKFINTRLEQITKRGRFDLEGYIDKPLLQVLQLFENNSLSTERLFDILLEFVRNPLVVEKLTKIKDWEDFCKNPAIISQIFNSSLHTKRIQGLLCHYDLLKLDIPRQVINIMRSLQGFEDLLNAFNTSMVITDHSKLAINVSAVVKEIVHFENLLMSLSYLPIELNTTLPGSMDKAIVYNKMIKTLLKKLKQMQGNFGANGSFPGYDLIDDILDQGYRFLSPSVKQRLILQSSSLKRTQIVLQFLAFQLQAIDDNSDFLAYMETSTTLFKWFQLIEKSPEVMDVVLSLLLDVIKDPNKLIMIQKVENWKSICQNTSVFQSLIPASLLNKGTNITLLQTIFCDQILSVLDGTKLSNHFIKMVKGLPKLIKQIQDVKNMTPDTFSPGKFYTDLVVVSMQFQKVLASFTHQNISFKPGMSLFHKFQVEYLQTLQLFALQWDRISGDYDVQSILNILIEINSIMNSIPEKLLSSATKEQDVNILIQYYTLRFANIHLKKINGTDKLVFLDYLKSNELKKLFGFIEKAPEFFKIFSHGIYRLIQHPDEVRHLLPHVTVKNLCTNMSIFEHIFDTKYLQINTTHIHNIVCNEVLLEANCTILEEDLKQNVEGFSTYLYNMYVLLTSNPENIVRTVSLFEIAKETAQFQNLIESLSKNPPQFVISSNNNWMNSRAYENTLSIIEQKLNVIEQELTSSKLNINLLKITEMVGEISGIDMQPIDIIVEQKVIEFINANLEIITASDTFNMFQYIESAELKKLLGLVKLTPEVASKLTASAIDMLINPKRILPFIQDETLWEKMCYNKTIFQNLFPYFKDDTTIHDACQVIAAVNFKKLLQQVNKTLPGFSSLLEMCMHLANYSFDQQLPVNYTAYVKSQMKLQTLISHLVTNPPKFEWGVNNNLTWDSITEMLTNITGEELLKKLANPQIVNAYVMQFFATLSKATGLPFQNSEIYAEQKVLEFIIANLRRIAALDTVNMFQYIQSTELRKLLGLVDLSPEVASKLIASAIDIFTNPQKILPFIQDETLWEKMCYNETVFKHLFPYFKDNTNIQVACQVISTVNFEKLLQQVNKTLPGFSSLLEMCMHLANYSFDQQLPVNYTAYVKSQMELQTLISHLVMNPPKFEWGVNNNLTWDSITEMLTNITGEELLKKLANPQILNTYLMKFLATLNKLLGPSSFGNMRIYQQLNIQIYVKQKVLDFLNANLKYITASDTFNMFHYMQSKGIMKLFGLIDVSPDMASKLATASLDLLINSQKLLPFIQDEALWEKMCYNTTSFQKMFPLFKDKVSIQFVCNLIKPDSEKLLQQLNQTLPGFNNILELLMAFKNYNENSIIQADFTAYAESQMEFQKLLQLLIAHPPKFILGINMDNFDDAFKKMDENSIVPSVVTAAINYMNLLQKIDMSQLPKHFRNAIHTERIKDYIFFNFLDFINQNLQALEANQYNLIKYLNSSSELSAFLNLVNKSDTAIELFSSSLKSLITNPLKVLPLLNEDNWEKICINKTIFSIMFDISPKIPNADLSSLQTTVCSEVFHNINMKTLMNGLNKIIPGWSKLVAKMNNISLNDVNLKVDPDSAKKSLLFYMKWIRNSEDISKKFKIGLHETSLSALPSILERIAKEWKELGKDAEKHSLPAIFQLMKLLNRINAFIPNNTVGKQLNMISRNLVSLQYLLRFMNIHLKNMSESSNFSETSLAQSNQILKLFGQLGTSPHSLEIILKTSLQILKNPMRIFPLFEEDNWINLCKDSNAFAKIFVTDVSQKVTEQQMKFCQEVIWQVDMNNLQKELLSLEGFEDFYLSVNGKSSNSMLDLSLLMSEATKLQPLIMQLISKPVTWFVGNNGNMWNSSEVVTLLNMWRQELQSFNSQDSVNQIDKVLFSLSPFLKQASRMSEWQELMTSLTFYLQTLDKILSQISNSAQNITALISNKLELQKTLSLLLKTPEMLSSVVYNMALKETEITKALESIAGSQDPTNSICKAITRINMTSIPGSNFNLNSYLLNICSVNFTNLKQEILQLTNAIQERPKRELRPKNKLDPIYMLKLVEKVWEKLSVLTNSSQSNFWKPLNMLMKNLILQSSLYDENTMEQEEIYKILTQIFYSIPSFSNHSQSPIQELFKMALTKNITEINEMYTKYVGDVWQKVSLQKSIMKIFESFLESYVDDTMKPLIEEVLKQNNINVSGVDNYVKRIINLLWQPAHTNETLYLLPPRINLWQKLLSSFYNLTRDGRFVISNGTKGILGNQLLNMMDKLQNQFHYIDMTNFTKLLSTAYNISDKTVALLLNHTDLLMQIPMTDRKAREHCYNGTFDKFFTEEISKFKNIPKEILHIINTTFCSQLDFYSVLVKLYNSQYLEQKINNFFSNQSGNNLMRKILLHQVKEVQKIISNLLNNRGDLIFNTTFSSFNYTAKSNSFGFMLLKMISGILPLTTDKIGIDTSNSSDMWEITLNQFLVQSSSFQLILRNFLTSGNLDTDSVVAEIFKQFTKWFKLPSGTNIQPEIAYIQNVVRNLNNINAMDAFLNETQIYRICHQMTSLPANSPISSNIRSYILMLEVSLEIFNFQKKNFSDIEDIICDSSEKSVVNIFNFIKKSGFMNLLNKVRSMFKNGNKTIDCDNLSKLASNFPEQFYREIHSLNSPSNAVKCLRKKIPKFMQFINHMDLMLTITAEMLDVVQDPLFQSILNNKQLPKFVAIIMNSILKQRTVIVKVSQLFIDPKRAEMYLMNNTNLSRDVIKTFFDSRINMKLIQMLKDSPRDMQDLICTHRNLSFYIDWPNSMESLENTTEILCKNLTATISGLSNYLDFVTITKELSLLNETFRIELPWLMNVSQEMANLLENVHRVLELEDFLSTFDFNQLSRLIPVIQQLVIDQVPQKIVTSILQILDDFKSVQNTSFSQEFIDNIDITIKGILGLKAVDKILALSAVFQNFLKSPTAVRHYMINNLNLTPAIANALINSTVSLAQFINFRSNNVKELLCKNISLLITLSNNTNVTYQEISNHLCNLETRVIYNLTQLIMEQLDIGEFVKQYVLLRASTLLKSTNMTVPIVKKTFAQMTKTSALVRGVGTSFKDNELYKIFSNFDSSNGDMSYFKELIPIICGRNASLMLVEKDGLAFFSSASEIKGKDGFSKSQRAEYNSLPNKFCKQLYMEVLKSELGEITWKFLKPLIRGKILYTPENKVTKIIIRKMEKFFSFIGQLQQMSQEWAASLQEVTAIRNKLQNLTAIMEYTDTEFVKDMLHDMFDIEKSTLVDSINMLNSMDDKTLSNLQLLLSNVVNYSSCLSNDRFQSVSFDTLQNKALDLSKRNEFLAAIIFLNSEGEEKEDEGNKRSKREIKQTIPKHLRYEIRMNIDYVPMTKKLRERYWRPRPEDNLPTEMKYLQGFIQLQDMIDKAIIESHMEEKGANVSIPGVHLKQFPFPCHMKDEYLHIISSYLLPIMMTLAWLASLGLGIRNIVQDRAEGQEEALRVMGMCGIINWLAWMCSTMIIMAGVCIIIIFILHFSTIFIFSNILLMFLYFTTFCFSTVMMCYMVSSFFSNTTLAVLTGLIIYLLSYIPYIVLQSLTVQLTFYQTLLVCLSSTTAFSFGSQYLSRYEEQMVGLQWSNINLSPIEGDDLSFSFACSMMAIDSLIYFIIAWYVKSIKKKKYGIPKPWFFPFFPKYWGLQGANSLKHYSSSTTAPDTFYSSDVLYENRPAKGPVGISLMNLSKRYGTETAVQDLSLKFHKGEITTILGQNGAGKTTTFNMLTGLMESTTGIVAFYDSDRGTNKSWLGICPQQNILFEYMTTEEHIRFYTSIKTGWRGKKLEREVRSIIKDVNLLHMRNTPAKQLSGGMQRRLCVALAFAGKSNIVVLDEPTAGVDPSARRSIWDLILKYKNDRTVIMSTHHLDEADILSDRVAILHKGKLLCCGSTLFLKRHLGKGYCLTLVKNPSPCSDSENSATDSYDTQKTLDFISKYIPGPEICENFNEETTILLPADDKIRGNFSSLFTDLDDNLNSLGIKSYGISDTTLEEVFLQARELSNAGLPMTPENMKSTLLDNTKMSARSESHHSLESQELNECNSVMDISSKNKLKTNNFTAFLTLIQKRASHYRRNWKMAVSVILLPCIFFAMAVGFSKIAPKNDYKRLRLSPALYGPNSFMFYKNEVGDSYGKDLLKWFSHSPGVSTTCMSDTVSKLEKPFECEPAETVFRRPRFKQDIVNKTEKCECVNYKFQCSKYASGIPPTQLQLNSTDFLQDLDSKTMPVSEYLLESYMKFIQKRYGGWTYERNENNKNKNHVTVWFNNKGHHSMPAFLNGYSNAILRTEIARNHLGNPEEYGITVFSNPIQLSVSTLNEESILFHASEIAISLIILLAISFIPAAFSIYLVKENINSEKYLFIISGVKTPIYWLSAFIWDLLVYCICLILIIIILAIFQLDSFWLRDNFSATILLIFLFGWASIPFMYTSVSFFKDATTSYMIVFCFNIFSGLCTSVCIFLLSLFQGTQALKNAFEICRFVFLIFPQFSLSYGLVSLGNNQLQSSIYAHFGMDRYENPFEMLHWHIISLFICGIIFFIITLFIEARNYCAPRDKTGHTKIFKEDEDVQHERMRVEKITEKQENSISILRLTKLYRQGLERILAVNQISLGIKEGECFGLLGVNGAGKTTTFKILAGQLSASSGEVFIKDESLSKNKTKARKLMGYCPQEDALDYFLTGRELLWYHARIKGVQKSEINAILCQLINTLNMENCADKLIGTYSGGMKRKLSFAIALLADPPIVLLDEPTAGMDPAAKRLVWNCILKATSKGQSVVLTSHSMQECDILCNRLCIMVNGQFKCIGSPQHLKNKFSKGYSVSINLKESLSDSSELDKYVFENLPGSEKKDSHNTTLQYSIPKNTSRVSKIFEILEQGKTLFAIQDYAVSQTTLDMVFLGFTNEQTDGLVDETDSVYEFDEIDYPTYAYDHKSFSLEPEMLFDNPKLKYTQTSNL